MAFTVGRLTVESTIRILPVRRIACFVLNSSPTTRRERTSFLVWLTVAPLQHTILRRDDIAQRSHRRAVHVQEMRERLVVAGWNAAQRALVVRRAQHHHAVLDLAAPAIEHRKTLDLAFAVGLGDELGHRAA